MLAAHRGHLQDDVAVRVAAQGDGIALQGEDSTGLWPLEGLQYRHEIARRGFPSILGASRAGSQGERRTTMLRMVPEGGRGKGTEG